MSHLIIQISLTLYILDCLAELAVRRLFIFLKKNLNLDYFREYFNAKDLLSERELKEYVLTVHEYFRTEKFLKLMIKKKRCKEFIAIMLELPDHDHHHITEEIRKFIINETRKPSKSNGINAVLFCFIFVFESLFFVCFVFFYNSCIDVSGSKEEIPPFRVSDELLKKHFHMLYTELEPRVIADEMFQAGQISVNDHDDIVDDLKKYNRLMNLLDVLKRKQLYATFLYLLDSLNYTSLLESLSIDRQPIHYSCRYIYSFIICFLIQACVKYNNIIRHRLFVAYYAVCIQRSFTTLQIELLEATIPLMKSELTESDESDIRGCSNTIRKISKLIKILISKGPHSCQKLFEKIQWKLDRRDLILKMKNRSNYIFRRGNNHFIFIFTLAL